MRFWMVTLTLGACLMLGAGIVLAQPAEGPACPGAKAQQKQEPANAQRPQRPERPAEAGQGRHMRRPPMFAGVMIALDTNRDGELSAEEIKAATENLKKLDKNEDGKIDRIEMRPPRPKGKRGDQENRPSRRGPRPDGKRTNAKGPRGPQGPGSDQGRRMPPPPPAEPES